MRDIVSPLDGFRSPFGLLISGGAAAFTPASLFASGEEGAWYEPSDTTCFTDTAGTTPAGVGDTVARINDLSGNGNHATQTTPDSRPVLARVPETGRRNLLERTEEFDNAAWTTLNTSASTTAQTPPPGFSGTVYLLAEDSSTNVHRFWQRGPESLVTSQTWTISVYIKDTGDGRYIQLRAVGVGSGKAWATFDPADGSLTESGGTDLVGAASTSIGDGWYRVEMTSSTDLVNTEDGGEISLSNSATGGEIPSYTGDGTSGVYIWGAQLEEGSTATDYQKVTNEYDVTEAGVTSLWYLAFDGVDDSLEIADSSGLRGADMTLFASVNLEGVSLRQDLFSCGNSQAFSTNNWILGANAGQLVVYPKTPASVQNIAPISSGNPYILVAYNQGTSVFTRVNGTETTSFTGEFGQDDATGAFLFCSDKSNVNSHFGNGRAYGFLAINRNLSPAEISDTESYVANLSGVTIP